MTYSYDPNGRRTRTTLLGGVEQTWTWPGDRLETVEAKTGSTVTNRFTHGYKNAAGTETGLRHTVTDQANSTTTYTYDPGNRLSGAVTTTSSGASVSSYGYAYDGAANLTRRTVNGTATTFGYNDANQLTSRSDNIAVFAYDGNGNETTGYAGTTAPARRTTSYTQADQPASFTVGTAAPITQAYAGNDSVERVRSGSTTFTTSRLGLASATTGTSTDRYLREPSGAVVALRRGGASYYYLVDGLGSVVAVTDTAGAVKNRYAYDPYGTLTTLNEAAGLSQPFRYTGQYHDIATGLYKLGLRYYDPPPSPASPNKTPSAPNPATRSDNPWGNRYLYAGCNPVNAVDPSGTASVSAKCFAGAVVAGGAVVFTTFITGGAALAATAAFGGPAAAAASGGCIAGAATELLERAATGAGI